jgi:hypothetical protein
VPNLSDTTKEAFNAALRKALTRGGARPGEFEDVDFAGLIDQGTDSSPSFGAVTATSVTSSSVSAAAGATLTASGSMVDGASAVGVLLRSTVTLANGSAKVVQVKNNATELLNVDPSGNLSLVNTGALLADYVLAYSSGTPLTLKGKATDGASAVGFKISQLNALSNAGAKLVAVYSDDGSTEKLSIGSDGVITSTGLKPTVGVGTVVYTGKMTRSVYKVTVPYTLYITASQNEVQALCTVPAKTKVVGVIADTTVAYAGLAGTIELRIGKTSGGEEYVLDHDVKTATITAGLLDADMGTALAAATAVQGGDIPSWSGSTVLYAQLRSGTGNVGDGAATLLSAGSTTFYIITEQM